MNSLLIGGDLNAINTNFSGLTTCTNFTSPYGFIYTLEADTAQFNGCITGSFSAYEAEIEILVITNIILVVNPIPASSNELTSKSYVDNLFNSSAKLSSANKFTGANTFTGLQTIVGDLKADNILVKNTTPTLNTHLTSKLYVDTALNKTAKVNSANTFTANQFINGDLNAINTNFSGLTTCTNFNATNGFIYTLEADTAEFVGCISGSFSTQEAEIQTLVITKRILVDYNNYI